MKFCADLFFRWYIIMAVNEYFQDNVALFVKLTPSFMFSLPKHSARETTVLEWEGIQWFWLCSHFHSVSGGYNDMQYSCSCDIMNVLCLVKIVHVKSIFATSSSRICLFFICDSPPKPQTYLHACCMRACA